MKTVPHVSADEMDEPQGDPSSARDTHQKDLDAQVKRERETSENELPSAQDHNPVPPGTTRP
jgi:hypothetical protein